MVDKADEALIRKINLDAQVHRFELVERLRFKLDEAEAELKKHTGELHPDDICEYAHRTESIILMYDEKRKQKSL